jgi:hypothetical protein
VNVIQWVKQGGRRYPQLTSPFVIGMVWTSIGQGAVAVGGGLASARLLVGVGR